MKRTVSMASWQDNLKSYDKITVYRSKAEAEMELEFIDLSKKIN